MYGMQTKSNGVSCNTKMIFRMSFFCFFLELVFVEDWRWFLCVCVCFFVLFSKLFFVEDWILSIHQTFDWFVPTDIEVFCPMPVVHFFKNFDDVFIKKNLV